MSDAFLAAASLEGVPSAFVAVRDGIDALLRDRGLRRSRPEDTAQSLLLGAAASSGLEGGDAEVDTLAAGGGDPIARASVRLSVELLGLLPTWRTAPLQAMARIHALAGAGTIPDAELGRPASGEAAGRLAALAASMRTPTEAPALVVAALAHAEIATCGAFPARAGAVGRAVERLVLVERGVDPASVTVPEAGHAAEPAGYAGALRAYAAGGSAGTGQWLRYAAEALARGAEASPLAAGRRAGPQTHDGAT